MIKKQFFNQLIKLVGVLIINGVTAPFMLANEAKLSQVEGTLVKEYKASAKVQARIDALDEATRQDYYDYLYTVKRAKQLEGYNQQLSRLIDSQNEELTDIAKQLASLQDTEEAALPLLNSMLATLTEFVARDLPFLNDERNQRIERLAATLTRADLSVAEKYRQVLEAYQIEVEYGRTVEAYSGLLNIEGQPDRDVTFFRLGRVALYYQTSDGQESGQWDRAVQGWKTLPEDQNWVIQKGIQLALQQTVPELLQLPLGNARVSNARPSGSAVESSSEKGGIQ